MEELIQRIIEEKTGDKEFALLYSPVKSKFLPDNYLGNWSAEIGNPSPHVCLGEVRGELCADGSTAMEALKNLLDNVRKDNVERNRD